MSEIVSPYDGENELGFLHPVLAQLGLPRRRTAARRLLRQSGGDSLLVEAGAVQKDGALVDLPLPYGGRGRVVLLHICSTVIRTRTSVIRLGDSAREVLRTLGLPHSGHDLRRVRDQIDSLAATRLTIGWSRSGIDRTIHTQVARGVTAWTAPDYGVIQLDPAFVTAIQQSAVPLDLSHIASLRGHPLGLDIYTWLAYRLPTVRRTGGDFVSWRALAGQFGREEFAASEAGEKEWRRAMRHGLRAALSEYRNARVLVDMRGMRLFSSQPVIASKLIFCAGDTATPYTGDGGDKTTPTGDETTPNGGDKTTPGPGTSPHHTGSDSSDSDSSDRRDRAAACAWIETFPAADQLALYTAHCKSPDGSFSLRPSPAWKIRAWIAAGRPSRSTHDFTRAGDACRAIAQGISRSRSRKSDL